MIDHKAEAKRERYWRKQGKTDAWISSWRRGYRIVSERKRK